jgi:hypothetical protein
MAHAKRPKKRTRPSDNVSSAAERAQADWLVDDDDDSPQEYAFTEYDLSASPNDFNTVTIFNFIESKAVKIPAFQRHYVWDIKRASKLIESLVMGIPIPQVFLYEEAKNSFLVVDGQQRLMSIYYFMRERFPRKEKRTELRRLFDLNGGVPEVPVHEASVTSRGAERPAMWA